MGRRIIAFRHDWIDQLYVLPAAQGQGEGSSLLQVAKDRFALLQLWTFQRIADARGFRQVGASDGSRNEEKEPDALYLWAR